MTILDDDDLMSMGMWHEETIMERFQKQTPIDYGDLN